MGKYCTNCGNKLDDNADICIKCGKLINNHCHNNDIKKNSSIGPIGIIVIVICSFFGLIFFFLLLLAIIDDMEDDYIEDIRYDDNYYENYNYTGTVNDTLYYDEVGVTLVDAIVYNDLMVKGDKIKARDGYEYLVFKFRIKNNSSSDKRINISKFKGYLDGEPVNYINNNDNKLDGVVKSNSILDGNVVFEVKKGWNKFSIVYDDILEFKIKSNTYKEKKRVEF